MTTKFYLKDNKIVAQDDGNKVYFHYRVDGLIGFTYRMSDTNIKEYYYKTDILGNIIGIYDENMNLIVKYVYDAWGNHKTYVLNDNNNDNYDDIETTASNPSTDFNNNKFIAEHNPFRYRSYYYDKESKLYYLNSRYYDPETGRFINADDVSLLKASQRIINGLNLYAYCKNNPIMNIDTNGNWSWKNFFGWVLVGAEIAVASIVIAYGIVASISRNDLASSTLIGFGTGVLSEIITSASQNLNNSMKIAIDSFKSGVIGGTAGFVAGGIGLIGEYYGNILGNALSNMTILSNGIKLSKIINPSIIISSISTMSSIVAGIGSGILIQDLFFNEKDMYKNATNSLKDEIKSIIYEIFRYFAL